MSNLADWNIFTQIVSVTELCIAGYCLYRFVKPFLQCRKTALATGGVYSLTMFLLYVAPLRMDVFTAYALGSLIAFFVMWISERQGYVQKAFLAVTYFSLRWFTAMIAELLYDYLYLLAESLWFRENPSMLTQFAVYAGVCMCYLVLVFVITAGAGCCITKNYKRKYEQMSMREMLMLVTPPFFGVIGYKIIRYYRNFYMSESRELSKSYDLLLLFYCVVAVLVVVILITLYQNIKAAQEEKLENRLLSTQMEHMKLHIEQVENLYQDIRSMKHDMKNHILTLERLYEKNETEQAKTYVQGMKSALVETAGDINSGNPVTDVILREWKMKSRQKNLCFRSDFHYPTGTNMNAFDVSVILNNALQNAIDNVYCPSENTEKSKTPDISVCSYHRNNAYMIEVSNRFRGNLKWDRQRDLPVTSKEKTDAHGYGLSNIRKVAVKYSGDIAIDLKDDEFRLSVMLMME